MYLIYKEEVDLMVDYVIFDVVRLAINEAIAQGKKIGFDAGAIAVEVKNLPKANSVSPTHELIFCEAATTGAFENHDKLDFLRNHVHDSHIRHLRGENIAPMSWGADSTELRYKTLLLAEEPSDYSIAIGVMGCGHEINSQVADVVLKNLPAPR